MGKPCKYCGVENLTWKQVEGRWKMFDEAGKQHVCDPEKKRTFKPRRQSSTPDNTELIKAIKELTEAIKSLKLPIQGELQL